MASITRVKYLSVRWPQTMERGTLSIHTVTHGHLDYQAFWVVDLLHLRRCPGYCRILQVLSFNFSKIIFPDMLWHYKLYCVQPLWRCTWQYTLFNLVCKGQLYHINDECCDWSFLKMRMLKSVSSFSYLNMGVTMFTSYSFDYIVTCPCFCDYCLVDNCDCSSLHRCCQLWLL